MPRLRPLWVMLAACHAPASERSTEVRPPADATTSMQPVEDLARVIPDGARVAEPRIFDLLLPIFDDGRTDGPAGDLFSLYYLSGPGGSKPVLIEFASGTNGPELRVATCIGVLGQPTTWKLGKEWRRKLSTKQAARLTDLARTLVSEIQEGRDTYDDEGLVMDGAMVATRVRLAGVVTGMVRQGDNDGAALSPFERQLFALGAAGFDGGIPGVRMRLEPVQP